MKKVNNKSLISEFEVELQQKENSFVSDYGIFSDKNLLDRLRRKIIQNIIDNNAPNSKLLSDYINDEIDNSLSGYDLTNLERSHIFNMIDNEINGYVGDPEARNITSFDEFQYFTSVTEIPEAMFYSCDNLESVVLPESVVTIEDKAFGCCTSLTSIVLPEGLEVIGSHAFSGSGLEGVLEIPANVKHIEWGTFWDADITSVKMYPPMPPVYSDSYNIFPDDVIVFVPEASVETYRKAYKYNDQEESLYTFLPLSCSDMNLQFVYEFSGDSYLNTDHPIVHFPLNVTLEGNVEGLPEQSEYGFYVKYSTDPYYDELRDEYSRTEYFTAQSLPAQIDTSVIVDVDIVEEFLAYYERYKEGSVSIPAEIGAYIKIGDSYIRFEKTVTALNFTQKALALSIEEFLKLDENDTYYELTGMITNIKSKVYGNLTIQDETGEVYVHGLTAKELPYGEKNDMSFESLGLKQGDILTLRGVRSSYNGIIQVAGPAYYVSHKVGEKYETPIETVSFEEFRYGIQVSNSRLYRVEGILMEVTNSTYGNLYISEDGTFDNYDEWISVYGLKAGPYASNKSFAELGLKAGDKITVVGYRNDFDGEPQLADAYLENIDGKEEPEVTDSLSNYSVRLMAFEQTWSDYQYVNNESDVPGYYFAHGLNMGVEADEELLAKSTEIGVYWMYGEEYKYSGSAPLTNGEMVDDRYLYFIKDFYSSDAENYRASYDIYIGTYAKLLDGTTLTFNQQPYTLSYDKRPEISMNSSVREFISAEKVPAYEYEYDDAGVVVDSVAVGEKMLYTYRDSINFNVTGGAWISYLHYAYKYDDNTYYTALGDSIGDKDWWSGGIDWTMAEDAPKWNSEYILYYDLAAGTYRTSVNQLAVNWYDEYKCSLQVVDETPDDVYVTGVETKSRSRSLIPATVKVTTKIKLTDSDAFDAGKYKPLDMKRAL